jgi:hypothetical protein
LDDSAKTLQDLFRTVNERLRERMRQLEVRGPAPLICECSDRECLQVIEVGAEDYAIARSSPNRYILIRGHARLESARTVESRDEFEVIEAEAQAASS